MWQCVHFYNGGDAHVIQMLVVMGGDALRNALIVDDRPTLDEHCMCFLSVVRGANVVLRSLVRCIPVMTTLSCTRIVSLWDKMAL